MASVYDVKVITVVSNVGTVRAMCCVQNSKEDLDDGNCIRYD